MSKLFVVATPIGNLGDMSQRAIDTLKNVDLILAEDTRHTLKLLNAYDIKSKLESYHKFNEKKKSVEIVEIMKKEDIDIAIVTDAGTPCISDPGYELIKHAHEGNIAVMGVPGCSAVINALSISGFDTSKFSFNGFIPREKKDLNDFYSGIKKSEVSAVVVYESPKRILNSIKLMREYLGEINIAVMSDMTKFYERIYRGNINDVIKSLESNENVEKGEYAIVIENVHESDEDTEKEEISLEALLVDYMIKNNITLKEAIKIVANNTKKSKTSVYDASLKLKELLN